MPDLSREVRRLEGKWRLSSGWPKRLDWIEVENIRGWTGQRFEVRFPITAIVGENGAGKSTLLQAAASVYGPTNPASKKDRFASDFFPETTWDHIHNAAVRYAVREGGTSHTSSVRKPTDRWRGNPARRKRNVVYIDLSRIQPVPARVGYSKLANPAYNEASAESFDVKRLARLSGILGRTYDLAKMALTDADANRRVPVITRDGTTYSGFHQGAGETTVAELLEADIPDYSLVLIDEVESSLHPRAQRRLIRDLADLCREKELQIVLSTHSPYVLEELPLDARAHILQGEGGRRILYGVSPQFAMSKMDDAPHYECDLYVEDVRAGTMLSEMITRVSPDLIARCQVVPYGAASVGQALGQMAARNRFPRPSCVFLDGDSGYAPGCITLPGMDAPERVVFETLQATSWDRLDARLGRPFAHVADACNNAMTLANHHDWVTTAATSLTVSGETLWQAMCAQWSTSANPEELGVIVQDVRDRLEGLSGYHQIKRQQAKDVPTEERPADHSVAPATDPTSPNEPQLPFEL